MDNRSLIFSSKHSMASSSDIELKQVFEHVSNQDCHVTIQRVNLKNQKIAKDMVQTSQFLFITPSEDHILTIYKKNFQKIRISFDF